MTNPLNPPIVAPVPERVPPHSEPPAGPARIDGPYTTPSGAPGPFPRDYLPEGWDDR